MAAHVEGDDLPFPRLLAFDRLVDGAGDAVRALRSRQESLRLDELAASFEDIPFVLRGRARVDEAAVPKEREDRAAAAASDAVALHGTQGGLLAEGVPLPESGEVR